MFHWRAFHLCEHQVNTRAAISASRTCEALHSIEPKSLDSKQSNIGPRRATVPCIHSSIKITILHTAIAHTTVRRFRPAPKGSSERLSCRPASAQIANCTQTLLHEHCWKQMEPCTTAACPTWDFWAVQQRWMTNSDRHDRATITFSSQRGQVSFLPTRAHPRMQCSWKMCSHASLKTGSQVSWRAACSISWRHTHWWQRTD